MTTSQILAVYNEQWATLAQTITACRLKPGKKAVHALRTSSRRISAIIEKVHEDHPRTLSLNHSTEQALRQLKKLRKLAGAIRDLDMHRKLLKSLQQERKPHSNESSLTAEPDSDIAALSGWLKDRRRDAAAELQHALKKQELKLEDRLEELQKAIELHPGQTTSPLTTARRWFARASTSHKPLNAENLHDLRKRTKTARYLAELEPTSQSARSFVRDLQRMHDAIGDWHDWQMLAIEVNKALGKEHTTLSRQIMEQRERAFQTALKEASQESHALRQATRTITVESATTVARRKPVQSDHSHQ